MPKGENAALDRKAGSGWQRENLTVNSSTALISFIRPPYEQSGADNEMPSNDFSLSVPVRGEDLGAQAASSMLPITTKDKTTNNFCDFIFFSSSNFDSVLRLR